MNYNFEEHMAQLRRQAREEYSGEDASPPPEERRMKARPIQTSTTERPTFMKASASSTAPKKGQIQHKVIDSSSPNPPTPQSPTRPNSQKPSRGDTSDTPMSDVGSPVEIPFADGVRHPPEWYTKIKKDGNFVRAAKQNKKNGQLIAILDRLKGNIRLCEEASPKANMDRLFNDLRFDLHKIEFVDFEDPAILRGLGMLDNRIGLPRIFDSDFSRNVEYPWDIKADAKQLYNRWWLGVLSVDLLRGIKRAYNKRKEGKRNADSIDKDFKRLDANHYGQGNLVNGQWWPTQLCTLRDGAHGSAQGGIYGEKERGVYSIVLSGGHNYGDEDNGDVIKYSGTDSKDGKATENTLRMIETCGMPENEKEPVRVIRSSNLKKENIYRPERGFRYDGLYDIVALEEVKKTPGNYIFTLMRRRGQDPIRWTGVEIRPTEQEKGAYQKLLDDGKIPN